MTCMARKCKNVDCGRTDIHAKGLCAKCYRASRRKASGVAKAVASIPDEKVATELKREQTRKVRMGNDILEGKLVERAKVEAAIAEKLGELSSQLESVTARVLLRHPGLSQEVAATMDDSIREALEAIF